MFKTWLRALMGYKGESLSQNLLYPDLEPTFGGSSAPPAKH